MRRIFSAIAFSLVLLLPASAQQRLYLFKEFQPSSILMMGYNRPETVTMNIDALGQKIYYVQGENLMKLTNQGLIDTLKIGGRTFVTKEGLLCEKLSWDDDVVYVNWKFKKVNTGSRGALGATTQAKVEVLHSYEFTPATPFPVTDWHLYTNDGDGSSVEIWERKNDNTYFFTIEGTEYKVKRLKDLYKAFPDKAPALKELVKKNKYTMENAQHAFQILAYLRSL